MKYPFYLKLLDFRYRFSPLQHFKKLAIEPAITRFLKCCRRENQVAKNPVTSGRMGIDIVFISDLHLHPEDEGIKLRFDAFLQWAKNSVKTIYILGDLFHAWCGDDAINAWSMGIARQFRSLSEAGVSIFYIHGNRDFLLGKVFANHANFTILSEPAFISLGEEKIMLVHGDRYCIKDKAHQRFRFLTRNKVFSTLFLSLPLKYRERLVNQVRSLSQKNQSKSMEEMDVVSEAVIQHMSQYHITTLIHGHTHKPGLTRYNTTTHSQLTSRLQPMFAQPSTSRGLSAGSRGSDTESELLDPADKPRDVDRNEQLQNAKELRRYVLSDWDDKPQLLCYDNTKGFYFIQF